MLTVVRPPSAGQGTRPSKRPRSTALTDVERMRLRAALRNLRALYGSWPCLAAAMGVSVHTLRNIACGTKNGGAGTARRAARAAGKTLEQLLGGLTPVDRCPLCGRGG